MPEGPVILEWSSNTQEHPILIGGFNPKKVGEAITQKTIEAFIWKSSEREDLPAFPEGESHFKIIELDFLGRPYYLAFQGFLVFDPPVESLSKDEGSKAIYYAAQRKEGLLVQYLPEYSETSTHDHVVRKWTELYRLLAGSAVLYTDEGQYLLEEVNPIVRPEVGHQLRTTNHPALTLIKIEGDPKWLDIWERGEGHQFRSLIPKNT